MSKKKNFSFIESALRYVAIVPLFYKFLNDAISLVEREAAQAKKNIMLLVICILLFGILFVSTWLCLLSIFFLYLVSLKLSFMLSLLIIFFLNLFLLMIIGLVVLNIKKELFFPECKRLLLSWKK